MNHKEFSRKGGLSRSDKKRASSIANIAKARSARLEKIKAGSTDPPAKAAETSFPAEKAPLIDSVPASVTENSASIDG